MINNKTQSLAQFISLHFDYPQKGLTGAQIDKINSVLWECTSKFNPGSEIAFWEFGKVISENIDSEETYIELNNIIQQYRELIISIK